MPSDHNDRVYSNFACWFRFLTITNCIFFLPAAHLQPGFLFIAYHCGQMVLTSVFASMAALRAVGLGLACVICPGCDNQFLDGLGRPHVSGRPMSSCRRSPNICVPWPSQNRHGRIPRSHQHRAPAETNANGARRPSVRRRRTRLGPSALGLSPHTMWGLMTPPHRTEGSQPDQDLVPSRRDPLTHNNPDDAERSSLSSRYSRISSIHHEPNRHLNQARHSMPPRFPHFHAPFPSITQPYVV